MNSQGLQGTRRALHGVAELVLAGPQYAAHANIRLRVTPGGFGTVTTPDLRVDRLDLVTPTTRLPLGGTFAGLARAAGVDARPLRDVYAGGLDLDPDDRLEIEPEAADILLGAFALGHGALRASRPRSNPCCGPSTSTSRSPWPR